MGVHGASPRRWESCSIRTSLCCVCCVAGELAVSLVQLSAKCTKAWMRHSWLAARASSCRAARLPLLAAHKQCSTCDGDRVAFTAFGRMALTPASPERQEHTSGVHDGRGCT